MLLDKLLSDFMLIIFVFVFIPLLGLCILQFACVLREAYKTVSGKIALSFIGLTILFTISLFVIDFVT